MTRVIQYTPKNTSANTEYRDIEAEDHAWLLNQLMEYLVKMAELSITKDKTKKIVIKEYWRAQRNSLPSGRNGRNSPESMVAGILDNMLYAEARQKDFTDKQCSAIEDISTWMHALFPDKFAPVVFQVRVI